MIIETTDNRFYRVRETNQPGLEHVWFGTQVKRGKIGHNTVWLDKKNARNELVRKEASRIVQE